MTWRTLATVVLASCCLALAVCAPRPVTAQDETAAKPAAVAETDTNAAPAQQAKGGAVQYLPFDAPEGMSHAVVVEGHPLVYTRQLLPFDGDGKIVGAGVAEAQVGQVLKNLEAVLETAGSGLDRLVRLNIYALSRSTADLLRAQLAKRLDPAVRPAITTILTPLGHRQATVAVDAVAVAAEKGDTVALQRCDTVAGDKDCADAAVLPRGGVAYLSGQPERGGLAESAVTQSLSTLLARLEQLGISPSQVVQLKVFLLPVTSADAAMEEVKRLFPGQLTPPVVFVEWIASVPVEIELIAQLPLTDQPAETLELYNPPELKPSPAFSRVALVRTPRQIHIAGLSGREDGNGEAQARDVFEQLKAILAETGSDMSHMAKATYYVSEDDGSRGIDLMRREYLDPQHPPAASKVTVHGVGQSQRSLTIDMIAVGSEK